MRFVTGIRAGVLALAVSASTFFASASSAETGPVIFAAASLKSALDKVAVAYADQGSNPPPVLTYGGSSALARQIGFGAPADLFLSANTRWMDWLEAEGLINAETRQNLLGNRLVLIATTPVDLDLTAETDLVEKLDGGRLAMALVDAVPAGIYGRQALETLGLWQAVKDHVAQTDNVRAALRLVATGQAPLGIVYATDARADQTVQVVSEFDPGWHDQILYPVALTTDSQHLQAPEFLRFLRSPEAQAVFRDYGFLPPPSAP